MFDPEANRREIARLDRAIARYDFMTNYFFPLIGLIIIVAILSTR